jgi:aspartate racemase
VILEGVFFVRVHGIIVPQCAAARSQGGANVKTAGLIGGMSWESTVSYYQVMNRAVGEALGGLHSARMVLYSVDFQEIEEHQHAGRWDEAGQVLAAAGRAVERAGAEFLVLCTNTMHRVASQVQAAVGIPLLHIADATAERVKAAGLSRVGLLGTRFTMEEDFYRGRLERDHDLEVLGPGPEDRELVHRVIYEELCRGRVRDESRREYERVVRALVGRGAGGVILGCTEIGLLLGPQDTDVPVFDTARIHAEEAARRCLATGPGGEGGEEVLRPRA